LAKYFEIKTSFISSSLNLGSLPSTRNSFKFFQSYLVSTPLKIIPSNAEAVRIKPAFVAID
jgi:hypothetical protein